MGYLFFIVSASSIVSSCQCENTGVCNCCTARDIRPRVAATRRASEPGDRKALSLVLPKKPQPPIRQAESSLQLPHILAARIAELRPVLPRSVSRDSSSHHDPSSGIVHGHSRHYTHSIFSPYVRAYREQHRLTPPSTASAESVSGSVEQGYARSEPPEPPRGPSPTQVQSMLTPPSFAPDEPIEVEQPPIPMFESGFVMPNSVDEAGLPISLTQFLESWVSTSAMGAATCTCADGCVCPNCPEHKAFTPAGANAELVTCANLDGCISCLQAFVISLSLPPPSSMDQQPIGQVAVEAEGLDIDQWISQIPVSPPAHERSHSETKTSNFDHPAESSETQTSSDLPNMRDFGLQDAVHQPSVRYGRDPLVCSSCSGGQCECSDHACADNNGFDFLADNRGCCQIKGGNDMLDVSSYDYAYNFLAVPDSRSRSSSTSSSSFSSPSIGQEYSAQDSLSIFSSTPRPLLSDVLPRLHDSSPSSPLAYPAPDSAYSDHHAVSIIYEGSVPDSDLSTSSGELDYRSDGEGFNHFGSSSGFDYDPAFEMY